MKTRLSGDSARRLRRGDALLSLRVRCSRRRQPRERQKRARRSRKGQRPPRARATSWRTDSSRRSRAHQGRAPGQGGDKNQRRRSKHQIANGFDANLADSRRRVAGNITFDNTVEQVEMWNSVEGRQEAHYDSRTDKNPPTEFANVAASVGKVLATIKIDPQGRIMSRTNNQPLLNPGIGDLTIPFPPAEKRAAIKAGVTWSIPDELRVSLEDGSTKKVQTQQQYRLEKIEAGVATIYVATQVLTPVSDPKVQSQSFSASARHDQVRH